MNKTKQRNKKKRPCGQGKISDGVEALTHPSVFHQNYFLKCHLITNQQIQFLAELCKSLWALYIVDSEGLFALVLSNSHFFKKGNVASERFNTF